MRFTPVFSTTALRATGAEKAMMAKRPTKVERVWRVSLIGAKTKVLGQVVAAGCDRRGHAVTIVGANEAQASSRRR
jgi:hypothetical protein